MKEKNGPGKKFWGFFFAMKVRLLRAGHVRPGRGQRRGVHAVLLFRPQRPLPTGRLLLDSGARYLILFHLFTSQYQTELGLGWVLPSGPRFYPVFHSVQ